MLVQDLCLVPTLVTAVNDVITGVEQSSYLVLNQFVVDGRVCLLCLARDEIIFFVSVEQQTSKLSCCVMK